MADYAVVRPRDDAAARQVSGWCDELSARWTGAGHTKVADVDDQSPADTPTISAALGSGAALTVYFGHGRDDAWVAAGAVLIDATSVGVAAGTSVVSIACNTGRQLGPDAITAGVDAWLGFTIRVPVVSPHRNQDPFGDAIVDALEPLGTIQESLRDANDRLYANLDGLATDFDTGGRFSQHPAAFLGYFGATALRDHIVVHGNANLRPLP